jgi:hypothetical protein
MTAAVSSAAFDTEMVDLMELLLGQQASLAFI